MMKRIAFLLSVLLSTSWSGPVHADSLLRIGMIAMPPAQGNPFFTTGTTPHMFYPAIYDTLTLVN